MTERQQLIVQAILRCLDQLDGGQAVETMIHAGVNLVVSPAALLSEFETALRYCESKRWIAGVRSELKGVKWSLSDKGKAALLET